MDIEAYQFTVYTMLIGMFIVFLAMILFSVIMVVLKSAARGRAAETGSSGGGPGNAGSGVAGSSQAVGRPLPAWAMVAVAAYLTAEGEQRAGPSAAAWHPEVNQYDPWLSGGQFSRRRVGV
jgi:hypothetical protein